MTVHDVDRSIDGLKVLEPRAAPAKEIIMQNIPVLSRSESPESTGACARFPVSGRGICAKIFPILTLVLAACLALGCASKLYTIGQASYSSCEGTATYDPETGHVTCDGVMVWQDGGPVSIPFANIAGDTLGTGRRLALQQIGINSPAPGQEPPAAARLEIVVTGE